MEITFAPLEGITNQIYRQAHALCFPGIARYTTPFLAPTQSRTLSTREKTDVDPRNNLGLHVVPQILTANPDDFLWCASILCDMGYREVNLNAGCPSGTVVSKHKGAGMLADNDGLDAFLDSIFAKCPVAISVKTRIGMASPQEFSRILQIYRQYPLQELIVHPRTRGEFYKGACHRETYALALDNSPFPVSYNGDLFSVSDIQALEAAYPGTHSVMLGRGLITDPGLQWRLAGHTPEKALYRQLVDRVYEGYVALWRDRNAVAFHLKEMWSYMIALFPGSEKHARLIRKANSIEAYLDAVDRLFAECDIAPVEDWTYKKL